MKYFVGIEGISRKYSVGVMCDSTPKVVARVRVEKGLSLHTAPRDQLRTGLHQVLRSLVGSAGMTLDDLAESTVCLGITGVTFPYDSHVDLPREFDSLNIEVGCLICTGDVEIAFASHTQSDRGSALICHMGSTAYVTTGTQRRRFGGWGPVIGDEGSGYAIGLQAVRVIGEEYDAGRPPSVLWREICDWLRAPEASIGRQFADLRKASISWRATLDEFQHHDPSFDSRTALFSFSHSHVREAGLRPWRSIASSLVHPVMRAFAKGDREAGVIVNSAACDLVRQYSCACDIAKVPCGYGPLVLYGGVFMHYPAFCELVVKKLAERCQREECDPPHVVTMTTPGTFRPAVGALLFAMGGSRTGHLRLPPRPLLEKVLAREQRLLYAEELAND